MSDTNRQWIFKSRPTGEISDGDLVLEESAIPAPDEGEIVVRTQYLSLDASNRVWMNEDPVYVPAMPLGVPMAGLIMGTVIESASDRFSAGDEVMGFGTWSEHCKAIADQFQLVPQIEGIAPKEVFGYFFSSVPTAYFGVREICAPEPGETMVVSGAAGSVGTIAGQLGKVYGCRVIGVAGGPEKCRLLTEEYGLDGAVDYKNESIGERLDELCPDGIDCFFDNVAGDVLDEVLIRMNHFGRVAACGATSKYNENEQAPLPALRNYPQIIYRRLKVQGFIAVFDYQDRLGEAAEEVGRLHREGKVAWHLQEEAGFENALTALRMLYSGGNVGKLILRVG